ncbi:hypothetical protein [Streptomyces sp. SCA2-2]|uniref:hypothetical protein n=1 Tax=Streptomyces sp. SCA2-2 TaxID=1563677 RepID=UPI001020640D|nr:hypothetical protein [Streptomyces sp. SCA2-2]RZE99497.1 hypothetical protein C0L86_11815 [Streptomyces sp. SCA2-2]
MNVTDEDIVVSVCLNVREDAVQDAMRHVLAPVAALHVERIEVETTHADGGRTGVVAQITVIRKNATRKGGADAARDAIAPVLRAFGVSEFPIRFDDGGLTGEIGFPYGSPSSHGPYGVYAIFVGVGVDPLNPEGEYADYSADVEDLIPE